MTISNRVYATVFAIVLVLTSACSRSAGDTNKNGTPAASEPTPVTSTNVVKVHAEALTLAKGESGTASVRLQIQPGYHVNANPASFPYLVATQLDLTGAKNIVPGSITYPDPLTKKFSFADAPLKVYEGETTIKAAIRVDPSAESGTHNLSSKLRVQACDDQVCYPPGTIEVTVPVTIK